MAGPVLETERLSLRQVKSGDLDAFAVLMADPEVVRYVGGETMTRDEVRERMILWRERFERDGFGAFALVRREDGRVLGRCGLLVWALPEWEVTTEAEVVGPYELELGWMLGREHWGKGYATEAAKALRDFALGELDRSRLISLIADGNTRSAAVAERLGMTIEGNARLHDLDVNIWSLAR